jgi:hypothetical protein
MGHNLPWLLFVSQNLRIPKCATGGRNASLEKRGQNYDALIDHPASAKKFHENPFTEIKK